MSRSDVLPPSSSSPCHPLSLSFHILSPIPFAICVVAYPPTFLSIPFPICGNNKFFNIVKVIAPCPQSCHKTVSNPTLRPIKCPYTEQAHPTLSSYTEIGIPYLARMSAASSAIPPATPSAIFPTIFGSSSPPAPPTPPPPGAGAAGLVC